MICVTRAPSLLKYEQFQQANCQRNAPTSSSRNHIPQLPQGTSRHTMTNNSNSWVEGSKVSSTITDLDHCHCVEFSHQECQRIINVLMQGTRVFSSVSKRCSKLQRCSVLRVLERRRSQVYSEKPELTILWKQGVFSLLPSHFLSAIRWHYPNSEVLLCCLTPRNIVSWKPQGAH